jgi:hypothetical protein
MSIENEVRQGWHDAIIQNGVLQSTSGNSNRVGLNPKNRHYMLVRIATGSLGYDQLYVDGLLLTTANDVAVLRDVSGSAQLVDIMNTGSWSNVISGAMSVANGYTFMGGGTWEVSQSVYGDLDGVFLNWSTANCNLAISDVTTRIFPS